MTSTDLVEAVLASERALFPRTTILQDPHAVGKALLALEEPGWTPATTGEPGTRVQLTPIVSGEDWAAYFDRRMGVATELGKAQHHVFSMVGVLHERCTRLGLRMYFATVGSTRVGAVGIFRVKEQGVTCARIQEVDIFPGHRGKGYGDLLMAGVTAQLRQDGVDTVAVGADEDDWPVTWYERHGFRRIARVALTR
ncbi:GNAT family N-acetyltransferase [Arsenicicoccus dermatophilus]|uniref:GNAT family N-acetyltransferase n=1 Tax=Arsenicicoccus dermatophilus TaxID=1076331 RepID=UPI001F4C789B|nr:GNAT family N-acetyltransferase [Arsenicicoccus dermatophilus]